MNQHYLRNFPDSENPYQICMKSGPAALSNAQLLAVILRTGTKDLNAIEICVEFLKMGNDNLLNIHQMSMQQMQKIPGIGKIKAIQLKCIGELVIRMSKLEHSNQFSYNSASLIAQKYMEELRHQPKEQLLLIMLDTKCHYIYEEVISIGSVSSSIVSPREIFLSALEHKAVNIVLLHNHPSGDPTPSVEDLHATRRICECGELLGIYLVDHIVIGDNKYVSFKEKGLL